MTPLGPATTPRYCLFDQSARTWVPNRPKHIVLCGSSRFIEVMAICGWHLERDERAIVSGLHLLPGWYTDVPHHIAEAEGVAESMDALHLQKIDEADEIFVVNVDHYVGKSTEREVRHAMDQHKPVRWYTDDPVGHRVADLIRAALAKHIGSDTTA